ncbi:MAG TPA: bifunctional riboflavin kinase/FAD synthetase [Chthoniobacterales bacterium]|nr:bifunctional riboflavin kinase/FAD synthetase [Chthoniobacterales bacterium]
MKILRAIDQLESLDGPTHLAIGVFDGLQIGHQAVIGRALESAVQVGGSAVVVTFDPHPVRVLRPEKAPRLLTSTRHKLQLIEKMGVNAVLLLEFTLEFSRTTPEAFVRQLAESSNHLSRVCVGQEWTFGANRSGSTDLLKELAPKFHFEVVTVPPVLVGERVVSSTLIRSAVECRDFGSATKYLGRPFTILGTVSEGRQLGRRLGFPTANLRAHNELFPPNGVYAAKARFRENDYGGVINIGIRPTVENESGERLLEIHLFDFDEQIYGQDVEVEFLEYLRPEQKFAGLEELKAQILRDATKARAIYEASRRISRSGLIRELN